MSGQLEQIRTFIAVAEANGFARAAQTLGTSASSVTRAVAELEAALGVQLFKRTTRKVALTQAGQSYYQRMLPVIAEIARIDDSARAFQTDLQGSLRISAPLSFGTQFLAGPIAAFRDEHPGIDLSINLTDSFVDIMQADYEMALRISGAPTDRSTIWRKIKQVRRTLVAAPSYLAAHGTPTHPAELPTHACLSYTNLAEGETWQLTDPVTGDTHPVRQSFRFACNNGDLLAQMAVAGQGIALLPDFLVAPALAAGSLVPVLPNWRTPEIWLTAFYPPYQKLPAAIERFTHRIERSVADIDL
ncbi:LysR family transcriptional regulator [Yoonia sp. R2331]|uniref:LysR family transcriptional regulator n=1 Tax=Yoonia sp. R2331 TaxID=3237238 RepID=UPI0034E4F2CB